ncbi:Pyrroline-5-carboxylate reductase [Rubellimicrobium mesophilum DSM 19309]|uniref:Pyrroline-5-carboxylate reductase n=1 Tax=Rubellimicrobium mesophilum DSM 19309 TaxID=442562 RepID=A0A017HLM3_9RHOB|nr:pyrroline-5-carboxylate reductase dimerization domain-containing protein [Rubellimicrobium mesophilum]EYD75225.1 Pyrroline-5-carboxylate reductase [Rubellimicrobium mesophilum DSM 19309]
MRLGIIGATGWLGSALGRGVLGTGHVAARDLVLLNRSGPRPDYQGHRDVTWATDAADLVERSDVVVLSVRPEDYSSLHLNAPGRLVVSFMAGVTMATLARTGGRIVRALPNGAAEHGGSYTPWLAAPEVTDADREAVRALLGAIGTEDEIPDEGQIDYLTGLSGSGAAYPALMAVAMLADARGRGLSEQVALRAVEAVICGGADMLRGRIGSASALVEAYRSYRGTTAAGLDAAEATGFMKAIGEALEAAALKAHRMGSPAASQ